MSNSPSSMRSRLPPATKTPSAVEPMKVTAEKSTMTGRPPSSMPRTSTSWNWGGRVEVDLACEGHHGEVVCGSRQLHMKLWPVCHAAPHPKMSLPAGSPGCKAVFIVSEVYVNRRCPGGVLRPVEAFWCNGHTAGMPTVQ
jgi:hypothetical protein